MFFEVVIIPLMRKLPQCDRAVRNLNLDLCRSMSGSTFEMIRDAIRSLLREEISAMTADVSEAVYRIHEWMYSNAEVLVQLIIFLSDRPIWELPPVDSLMFILENAERTQPLAGEKPVMTTDGATVDAR
jgi:hypothetical protein